MTSLGLDAPLRIEESFRSKKMRITNYHKGCCVVGVVNHWSALLKYNKYHGYVLKP